MFRINNLFGNTLNRTFKDVFPDKETFATMYQESGLAVEGNTVSNIDVVYYLLYARYANSTIASISEEQFAYKVFSLIFAYGPAWEAKLKLQEEIRKLVDDPDKLTEGAFAIYNHSYNPSVAPETTSDMVLKTINDQNTSRFKKGKLDAFAMATEILKTDVTEAFVGKFKKLFITVVEPTLPWWELEE